MTRRIALLPTSIAAIVGTEPTNVTVEDDNFIATLLKCYYSARVQYEGFQYSEESVPLTDGIEEETEKAQDAQNSAHVVLFVFPPGLKEPQAVSTR